MFRKEKARKRFWFWFITLSFILLLDCIVFVRIFGDTLGMILLSPFIFASLPPLPLSNSWFVYLVFYETGNG